MERGLEKLINKYTEFILGVNPSKSWKVLRFLLHWITIPIKLIAIGSLGTFQIIKKSITSKARPPLANGVPPLYVRQSYFRKILLSLPILRTTEIECYVNRVPYYSVANGYNHNPDHQCSRHSTYYFLMSQLDLQNEKMEIATRMHMQGKWLCRGFIKNPYNTTVDYNVGTVSGDMLVGLNLAIISEKNPNENFDQLIAHIIENDYALLEGKEPDPGDAGYELYKRLLITNSYRPEKVLIKSARGMWQPGLETVGAQALTILSALRVAEIKNGSREAGKHYRKLLWKYGYGLLSIFPTAYIDSRRGYFNDHNCLIALYTLSKLSKSKFGKLFWKIPMIYVWALSKHWYNGYFTGLVKECYPESISQDYINKCLTYLYEMEPKDYSFLNCDERESSLVPVPHNQINADEFTPDVRQDMIGQDTENSLKIKTGLGFLACAIMLEENAKDLLEKNNS